MRQFVFSILGVVFLSSSIFSQSHLMVEIDKLTVPNKDLQTQFIPIKSFLSCDFFQKMGKSVMGISDAGLDSTTAYHQAYLRATSILALRNAKAKGMSDFYTDENSTQKSSNYEEICQIKTSSNLPVAALKVNDSHWLESGELILFLNIDSNSVNLDERLKVNCSATIYYKENEEDGNQQILNRIILENESLNLNQEKIHTEKSSYTMSNNRWTSKEIVFDYNKIQNNQYKFFYESIAKCDSDVVDSEDIGTNTIDGLWTAFVGSLYRQLSAQLKPHFLKIKNMGEVIDNKMTTLNRESGFVPFGCRVVGGIMLENKFQTKLKISDNY